MYIIYNQQHKSNITDVRRWKGWHSKITWFKCRSHSVHTDVSEKKI